MILSWIGVGSDMPMPASAVRVDACRAIAANTVAEDEGRPSRKVGDGWDG